MNYIRLVLRRKLLQPLKELLIGFTREAARVIAQNTEPGDCGCLRGTMEPGLVSPRGGPILRRQVL